MEDGRADVELEEPGLSLFLPALRTCHSNRQRPGAVSGVGMILTQLLADPINHKILSFRL